VFNIFTIS